MIIKEIGNPVELVNSNSAPLYSIWLTNGETTLVWDGSNFQTNDNIDIAIQGVIQPEQLIT